MLDFVEKCIRTESLVGPAVAQRLVDNGRALHAAMGIQTEGGELTDQLKKHVYYGKALDAVNLKEELADVMWYVGLLCDVLGTTVEELQELVIAKLSKRYPDKFTEAAAIHRDLEGERELLQQLSA